MSSKINQVVVFCLNQVTSNHLFPEAFYLHGPRPVVMALVKSSFWHKRKKKEGVSATCLKAEKQTGHIDLTRAVRLLLLQNLSNTRTPI